MEVTAANDEKSTRRWLLGDEESRALSEFYTDYETKITVEDGYLIERKIKRQRTEAEIASSSALGYSPISSFCPRKKPEKTPEEKERLKYVEKSQTIRTANAALAYYNTKRRSNYELVQPINSSGNVWNGGVWLHCNFTAKESCNGEKFFFAEMKLAGVSNYKVTTCRSLDGIKTTNQCMICGESMKHPTGGFRHGLPSSKRHALRRRRDGKVLKS